MPEGTDADGRPDAATPALVSVVVPACNAADTIERTLHSIRTQTHSALDVVVVDDGSTDATADIVRRHAAADPRLRLIEQANAGVAAARNTGWAAARSDIIAFIDADDLWAPTKIERQLARFVEDGGGLGLVYTWSAFIDADDAVTDDSVRPRHEGRVLEKLLEGNFIGNGSAAMVTRRALIDAGGFDSRLRELGAQGCEDILFYCRVAARYDIAVVPEHLTGYRVLPQAMSAQGSRMLRSWLLVMAEMGAAHPALRANMVRGTRHYADWLLRRALKWRTRGEALRLLAIMGRADPGYAVRLLATRLPARAAGWALKRLGLRRTAAGRGPDPAQPRPVFPSLPAASPERAAGGQPAPSGS